MSLYEDSKRIISSALVSALPDSAVKKALAQIDLSSYRVHLIAVGKAAWQMAKAAHSILESQIYDGIIVTKYDHAKGSIANLRIFEAGHPISDQNTYNATKEIVRYVKSLDAEDAVLFLLSGGGSALFEEPLISSKEYEAINSQLLACGADIVEINTIRKRLSAVKGGRFAKLCAPAKVFSIILSDVLGDPIDAIASGPAYPDSTTCDTAKEIVAKYGIKLSEEAEKCLEEETPKTLDNVETWVTGSVRQLCAAAFETCKELGYEPMILTDMLSCTARDAGVFLGNIARTNHRQNKKMAFIAGGETTVKLVGAGLGGRNQELALAAAKEIAGLKGVSLFSLGSDGTDGPTDAAGGYVDWQTAEKLEACGIDIDDVLQNNDSYHALERVESLIKTGPTGTNVNDVAVLLIDKAL